MMKFGKSGEMQQRKKLKNGGKAGCTDVDMYLELFYLCFFYEYALATALHRQVSERKKPSGPLGRGRHTARGINAGPSLALSCSLFLLAREWVVPVEISGVDVAESVGPEEAG